MSYVFTWIDIGGMFYIQSNTGKSLENLDISTFGSFLAVVSMFHENLANSVHQ